MSHTNAIFGKDIYSLTLSDLEAFFSEPQEETSILEFKRGDVELDSIYKVISAFLNTDGGVLIIGSPKEQNQVDKSKSKVCQGELTPSRISNQDKLMHSIASNIIPSPIGIKVQTITFANGCAYVLEVTKSINPPHQVSNDGRYYIRLEREAKPAPHGIVEALMNQMIKIQLDASISINKSVVPNGYAENEEVQLYSLLITVTNDSMLPAHKVEFNVNLVGYATQKIYNFYPERKDLMHSIKRSGKRGHYRRSVTLENAVLQGVPGEFYFFDIVIEDSYAFLQLTVWAENVRAISKLFKIYSDRTVVDISTNDKEYQEVLAKI